MYILINICAKGEKSIFCN